MPPQRYGITRQTMWPDGLLQQVEELLQEFQDHHFEEHPVFGPIAAFGAFLGELAIPAQCSDDDLATWPAFALVQWAATHPPPEYPPCPHPGPPPADLFSAAQAQWACLGHHQDETLGVHPTLKGGSAHTVSD